MIRRGAEIRRASRGFSASRWFAATAAFGILLGACAGESTGARLDSHAPRFDGRLAWQYALRATRFGPRPPGSAAHARLLAWIESELAHTDWQAFSFTASTPVGPIVMTDVIARFPGRSPGIIVLGGHYDTLYGRPHFVGANDGGSSTGILLALARHFRRHPPRGSSVWLVWFDGEEAIRRWRGHDHTYGSRALVEHWRKDGTLRRIRALLVLDMIGDRRLDVARVTNATPWLTSLVCDRAAAIGAGAFFCHYSLGMEDDDTPFLAAGVPAADLIDFDYGPLNSYWHTSADTPDKLAPASFTIVGSVVLSVIHALDADRSRGLRRSH